MSAFPECKFPEQQQWARAPAPGGASTAPTWWAMGPRSLPPARPAAPPARPRCAALAGWLFGRAGAQQGRGTEEGDACASNPATQYRYQPAPRKMRSISFYGESKYFIRDISVVVGKYPYRSDFGDFKIPRLVVGSPSGESRARAVAAPAAVSAAGRHEPAARRAQIFPPICASPSAGGPTEAGPAARTGWLARAGSALASLLPAGRKM